MNCLLPVFYPFLTEAVKMVLCINCTLFHLVFSGILKLIKFLINSGTTPVQLYYQLKIRWDEITHLRNLLYEVSLLISLIIQLSQFYNNVFLNFPKAITPIPFDVVLYCEYIYKMDTLEFCLFSERLPSSACTYKTLIYQRADQ